MMSCVVKTQPKRTPIGEATKKALIQVALRFSFGANRSVHTGQYMLTNTWKNPVMKRHRRSHWYSQVIVKQTCETAFRHRIEAKTIFVLTVLKKKEAAIDPRTSPANTIEPRRPYSVLETPRYSFIIMAPAGITPWSMLMIKFIKKIKQNAKLTTPGLSSSFGAASPSVVRLYLSAAAKVTSFGYSLPSIDRPNIDLI